MLEHAEPLSTTGKRPMANDRQSTPAVSGGITKRARRGGTERRKMPAERGTPTTAKEKALHRAYLHLPDIEERASEHPGLRDLAVKLGVPLREAKELAFFGGWELERRAARARAWLNQVCPGAKTEEEFAPRFIARNFSHLLLDGPEGARLAIADAREAWTRVMAPALLWDARQEQRAAKDVYYEALCTEGSARLAAREAA